MAVFRPLRANFLLSRCHGLTKYNWSSKHYFNLSKDEPSSNPKSLSRLLQVFIKKPLLDKETHKNVNFLYFLRANLQQIINNKSDKLLESMNNGNPNVEEFDKLTRRAGLSKLCDEEIEKFFPELSSLFSYITCKEPVKLLGVYISNEDFRPQQQSNVLSIGRFFKAHQRYSKVVLLLRSGRGKVFINSYSNLSSSDTRFLLPGCNVKGGIQYKILLATLAGLSLGSASSSVVSEILFLPSGFLIALTYVSTLSLTYVWGKWKDNQSSLLLHKCKTLDATSSSSGDLVFALIKQEAVYKIILDVLALYSYLLKEREANLRRESEYVAVDDRFKRMFGKWSLGELALLTGKNFDFNEILGLMEQMEMVRMTDESSSLYKVVPFEEALLSLESRELSFSDIFDTQP